MLKEVVETLTNNFESHARKTEDGVEFWLARDLQKLLGYLRWENFQNVLSKAKIACEVSKHEVSDHFRDVTKMIQTAKQAEREVLDIILTRYACYLIAQNGDPRKEEIALAQSYFAIQTRKQEIQEQLIEDSKRVFLRDEMKEHNKNLVKAVRETIKEL